MVLIRYLNFRVILGSSFGKKLWMIVIWARSPIFTIGKSFWNDINVVKGYFSLVAYPKKYLSLHFCMYSLIKPNNNIFSRLPLEPSLSRNDIIRVNSLSSKLLDTLLNQNYPRRLPAESLVFWVELACIFEAWKITLVVKF